MSKHPAPSKARLTRKQKKQRAQRKAMLANAGISAEFAENIRQLAAKEIRINKKNKLSAAVLDYVRPFLEEAKTPEDEEKAIGMGIVIWNLAIHHPDDLEEAFAEFQKMAHVSVFDAPDFKSLFGFLYTRKQLEFGDDQRIITDFQISQRNGDTHLQVATMADKDVEG